MFDNLTQLVHTNLVKFHKYWTDSKSEKPRVSINSTKFYMRNPVLSDNLHHRVHVFRINVGIPSTNTESWIFTKHKGKALLSERGSHSRSQSLQAWKKWTTQILSALNYLHSSDPAIIHGNLTCNTVFIQQNGLIKIGCGEFLFLNYY